MSITQSSYGTHPSGEAVSLFTLKNKNGLSATITNLGGIIVSLHVPDRNGNFSDIVLGKDSLEGYLAGHPNFGCITGRVAGRISYGKFSADGASHQVAINNHPNSLHGGEIGYSQLLWNAEIINNRGVDKLLLSITDPDGSNHFPGTVSCSVAYALLDDNSLEICYQATTDKTTPFNPTNHSYFNLKGADKGEILGHSLQICADSVASVDENLTLLGRRDPVVSGFNDFRQPITLKDLPELCPGNADIHFFLQGERTEQPKLAAVVKEPESGRVMEVLTTEPGVQFYAGLCLSEDAPEIGKNGAIHGPLTGLCLETQDYPDSINYPDMGAAILKPGDTFKSTTLYRFSVTA